MGCKQKSVVSRDLIVHVASHVGHHEAIYEAFAFGPQTAADGFLYFTSDSGLVTYLITSLPYHRYPKLTDIPHG